MYKTIRKIVLIVLVISALSSVSAFAAETRASLYISSYRASVIPTGNGKVNIEFSVVGTGTMTKIGSSVIQVYKSDGTLVATFSYTNSGYENMMGANTYTHTGSVSYSGISGQSYYSIVTFFAKNSNGSDSKTYTTSLATA
jgi:hypothetical protein